MLFQLEIPDGSTLQIESRIVERITETNTETRRKTEIFSVGGDREKPFLVLETERPQPA